jgi:hypothetical protein
VFENGMLRKIFGPTGYALIRYWRKLHNEELNDLHFSPDIILVLISRRLNWQDMWNVRERGVVHTRFWWIEVRERDHL